MGEGQAHEHYVYIVRCIDGSLYTGYTRNLEARIATHNAGKGSRYTRARRPVEPVAWWSFRTKREALQIEYQIKQLPRAKKLEIIEQKSLLCDVLCAKHVTQQKCVSPVM